MSILGASRPIESGGHILRARRTAATTRVAVGAAGVLLVLAWPSLSENRLLCVIGFATILASAAVQLAAPRLTLLSLEESLSASAGVMIVGFGGQRVGVLSLLWLVAIASGVLARGGRVHWIGRAVMLCGLLLPVVLDGGLSAPYAAFVLGTIALLLTAGRLTSELNALLRQARLQADSAETLLLAGDIAARMAEHAATGAEAAAEAAAMSEEELAAARLALARLIEGEGLTIVVQPIVDIGTGEVHAYEALARFGETPGTTPLHWFALADRLGGRAALERACLREALALLDRRPPGTSLSVNVSAPVLAEAQTRRLFEQAAERRDDGLRGLIVEITEETLVAGGGELEVAIGPLLERGAALAVDDMGAGYSGLRQITAVRPAYLKLDRSLATGIDSDAERRALVSALVGYARQVGCELVVEGIETTAELEALRGIGVKLVQGFRLGRPGEPWPRIDAADARGPAHEDAAAGEPFDPSSWKAPPARGHERSSRVPTGRP
ncbi:MAG TPA: EAL domain-containing protein [Solirubrobacteraceae bacterium]|nr:EAL domain-containing protein [Solirubrobacteraceae bacterium]